MEPSFFLDCSKKQVLGESCCWILVLFLLLRQQEKKKFRKTGLYHLDHLPVQLSTFKNIWYLLDLHLPFWLIHLFAPKTYCYFLLLSMALCLLSFLLVHLISLLIQITCFSNVSFPRHFLLLVLSNDVSPLCWTFVPFLK